MATRFQTAEARLNQAVFLRLSDATATLPDASTLDGIFDNGYDEQSLALGIAATNPMFTVPSSAVSATILHTLLVIGGTIYKVVEIMPDGTGVTRLQLRT